MKIKLYSKQECLAISVEEHSKSRISAAPWDLMFGLPDEVFREEVHEVSDDLQEFYLLKSEWAVPKFFVKEVLNE